VKRILVAEDDPETAAALKLNLEDRLAVATNVVTNGALVLDQLTATPPDLLILDVSLPGLNGVDVFDLIRGSARFGKVPVLFVTATPDRAREAFAHCGIRRCDGEAVRRRCARPPGQRSARARHRRRLKSPRRGVRTGPLARARPVLSYLVAVEWFATAVVARVRRAGEWTDAAAAGVVGDHDEGFTYVVVIARLG